MRNSSIPRRSPTEPTQGTITGKGSPSQSPRWHDLNLHRLACDLATEWGQPADDHAENFTEIAQ